MWLPVVFFCAAGTCQFWTDSVYTNKQECLQAVEKVLSIIESHPETSTAGQCFKVKYRTQDARSV